MKKQTDLFEQLRLLCYSKSEVASIIGVSSQKMYRYAAKKEDIPEGVREKIEAIIEGGANKKWHTRAEKIQKAAKEHKKAIAAAKKDK